MVFFAETLKRTVYVASRTVNSNGVSEYSSPVEYKVNCYNVLPASASADLVTVGTSIFDYQKIVGDPIYLSGIKVLDKVYVNSEPDSSETSLAENADYVVNAIMPATTSTVIILKRLVVD